MQAARTFVSSLEDQIAASKAIAAQLRIALAEAKKNGGKELPPANTNPNGNGNGLLALLDRLEEKHRQLASTAASLKVVLQHCPVRVAMASSIACRTRCRRRCCPLARTIRSPRTRTPACLPSSCRRRSPGASTRTMMPRTPRNELPRCPLPSLPHPESYDRSLTLPAPLSHTSYRYSGFRFKRAFSPLPLHSTRAHLKLRSVLTANSGREFSLLSLGRSGSFLF